MFLGSAGLCLTPCSALDIARGRHTRQTVSRSTAWPAAIIGEVTSACLVSTAAPSETVAKQFRRLSNHSTVTATEGGRR